MRYNVIIFKVSRFYVTFDCLFYWNDVIMCTCVCIYFSYMLTFTFLFSAALYCK